MVSLKNVQPTKRNLSRITIQSRCYFVYFLFFFLCGTSFYPPSLFLLFCCCCLSCFISHLFLFGWGNQSHALRQKRMSLRIVIALRVSLFFASNDVFFLLIIVLYIYDHEKK